MKKIYILFLILSVSCFENLITPEDNNPSYTLCYRKPINQRWEIVLNNLEDDSVKNISNNQAGNYSPEWSPDGKEIIFRYDKGVGGADIYSYNLAEDSLTNLTFDLDIGESASQPIWTPDCEKILFQYHKMGEPWELYIMNKDGSNMQSIMDFVNIISFYNDSYTFIYSDDYSVYKSTIDGTNPEFILNLKNIGQEYTFAYDFNTNSDELLLLIAETPQITNILATYNINSGKIDTLSIADSGWVYLRPQYSNDFSKIAYIEKNYDYRISKIVVLQGHNKTEVIKIEDKNEWIDYSTLVFSPQDKYIAYSKNINQESEWVWWKSYLYTVNIVTKEIKLIDRGSDAKWKPLISNY